VTYSITIKNNSGQPVRDIDIWDTLPDELTFISCDFSVPLADDSTENYLHWNLGSFELNDGEEETIKFTAVINDADLDSLPITNRAFTDYHDAYYNELNNTGKHPPVHSEQSFYPTGRPVVFPNPYNPEKDGVVRFRNIVPNSLIDIYTISGENVITLETHTYRKTWDGKNRYGEDVSSGLYFFVIKNLSSGSVLRGKLFVVRNE